MVARITTAAFQGIDVQPVDVQVHMASGLPAFTIVGPIILKRSCALADDKLLHPLKKALLILCASITLSACSLGDKTPGFVAWSLSPDANHLSYSRCIKKSTDCRISTYDFRTGHVSSYQKPTVWRLDYPTYSPDRKSFVIAPDKRGEPTTQIVVMNVDGTRHKTITSGFKYRSAPSFSDDGSMLVYRCSDLKKRTYKPFWGVVGSHIHLQALCVLNLKTSRETKITHISDQRFGKPVFLPGGQYVLYTRRSIKVGAQPQRKAFITNIVTQETTQASFPPNTINKFQLSADGKRMVFTAVPEKLSGLNPASKSVRFDLYVWEGDGNWPYPNGKVRRLTSSGAYQSGFSLSADGQTLVYALDESRRGNMTFYRLDFNTDKLTTFRLPKGVDRWIDVELPPSNQSNPSGS